jgi:hypothetical protein
MRNVSLRTQYSRERGAMRLGCMGQIVALILILLAVGVIYVALFPWAFFMGGNFHPLGNWRGWGRMHSKTAGDYFLYVEILPEPRTMETIIPHTFLKGTGYLCTPKGERYSLRLSGSMPPHIYLHTVGQPVELDLHNWRDAMPIAAESRPSFEVHGRWGQGELTGDDHNTLSIAFLPDGTLRPKGAPAPASQHEDLKVTLREGTYSEFRAACSASGH